MIPLLLLPGMMCDARLFAPQVAAFGGDRTVHVARITEHDTVEALAATVLGTAPPRFVLAGLSMGGIVAMEMLAQAPDRIERLALLDTNPLAEAPEIRAARERQIVRVEGGALADVMREDMTPNYLADGPDRGAILYLCMAMALDFGPEVFVRQSRALATRADRTAVLETYRRPALVLMGEHDRLCPRARHDLMHDAMPQSRLMIVRNAGHLPTIEQPATTNAALARWLEE